MSTHNIGFYEDLTKIIFELASNIMKRYDAFLLIIKMIIPFILIQLGNGPKETLFILFLFCTPTLTRCKKKLVKQKIKKNDGFTVDILQEIKQTKMNMNAVFSIN